MRFVPKNENGQTSDSIRFNSCLSEPGNGTERFTPSAKNTEPEKRYSILRTRFRKRPLCFIWTIGIKRDSIFYKITIYSNRSWEKDRFNDFYKSNYTDKNDSNLNITPVRILVGHFKTQNFFQIFKIVDYFRIESYEMKFVLITKKKKSNNK